MFESNSSLVAVRADLRSGRRVVVVFPVGGYVACLRVKANKKMTEGSKSAPKESKEHKEEYVY